MSASQWLRDEVETSASRRVPPGRLIFSAWAVGVLFTALLFAAVLLRMWQPVVLPGWAPPDAGEAIGLAWQVQTSIAAIAFAGLALIIQLAANPPVAVRSSREVLYRETHFRFLLSYAGGSSVLLGVVSTWLPSDGGALLCFLVCFVGTLVLIGFSYLRAARFFLDDRHAAESAIQLLLAKLDDGIRDQRVVAEANRRLGELFSAPEPVRRSRRVPPGRLAFPLAEVTATKRVADFDVAALRHAGADLLRAVDGERFEAAAQTALGPARTAADPALLLIKHGVNSVVRPGQALFDLVADSEPDPELLRAFDQRLRRCVRWTSDGEIDDELVSLKDSLLTAAHAGTTGALERGLGVYADLFTRILRAGQDGSAHFAFGAYGRYWRATQRSLREVSAVAMDRLGDAGVTLVADHAFQLCTAAFDEREIEALQEFLGLYPVYLRQVTDVSRTLSPEYLLVSAQNLIELRIAAGVADDPEPWPQAEIVVAGTIADLLKVCVDRGDTALLRRVLIFFGYPSLSRRLTPAARTARTAAVLAALGWAFFRWRTDGQPPAMKEACRVLLDALATQDIWAAYVWAVNSAEAERNWDRWEMERAVPFQFRFMEFHSFLTAAAVAAGIRMGMTPPVADPSPSDADRARALLDAYDSADETASAMDLPAASGAPLEAALTAVIERRREIDDKVLRESPLEDERIGAFIRGFTEALRSSGRRLSDVLATASAGGSEDVDEAGRPEGTKLHINALVPREYFITDDRVSADPAELGESVGAGLLDGENAYLVKVMAAGQARQFADLEKIEQRAAEPDTYLVVVNDWKLAEALGVRSWTADDQPRPAMFLSVEGAERMCLVCDVKRSSRVVREPERLDQMGPSPHELPGVAVAVRDYGEPAERPVAQVIVATSLRWEGAPGRGVEVLVRGASMGA